jgi:hypothetical protein
MLDSVGSPWRSAIPLALALTLGSAASAQTLSPSLEREARAAVASLVTALDVERRLLAQDVRGHALARVAEIEATERLGEVSRRLDAELAAQPLSGTDLGPLLEEVEGATASAAAALERVRELRRRIDERLRRIALVEADLRVLAAVGPEAASPLAGSWELRVEPGARRGVLDLDVQGTLVTGRYRIGEDRSGSVQGTYAGGGLRLELHDRQRGFDAVLTGHYDPAGPTLTGQWQLTELASGGPGAGTFRATRSPPSATAGEETPDEETP